MKKTDYIKDYNKTELADLCASLGFKEYNGKQLYKWLFQKHCTHFEEMSNIPKNLQRLLIDKFKIQTLTINKKKFSKIDETIKFLLETYDGKLIETVSMIDNNRHTVCISSQIGCNVDCDFCATGKMGLIRNLNSSEIIEQIQIVKKNTTKKITNIVFMGMGEPFLNYKSVIKASLIFSDTNAFNLSSR